MENQVFIMLTSLDGSIHPSERVLNLHPERKSIGIGRASKNVHRELHAAEDNAWLDSPVVSRNHAQLSLDVENNAVTIQDVGSRYGTYLNDIELEPNEPIDVVDGDIVVLGAEVSNGPKTYQACALRINYKFSFYNNKSETLTFNFPEPSDAEDDDDEKDEVGENSETELVEAIHGTNRSSSVEAISTAKVPLKASQGIDAIDLTGEDSHAVSVATSPAISPLSIYDPSNRSESTSSSISAEKFHIKAATGRNSSSDDIAVSEHSTDADSEDEVVAHLSDLDCSRCELEDAQSHVSDSIDGHDESFDSRRLESRDPDAEIISADHTPEPEAPEVTVIDYLDRLESLNRKHNELEEFIRDGDTESDFDLSQALSQAGRQGIHTLIDEGLLDADFATQYGGPSMDTNRIINTDVPSTNDMTSNQAETWQGGAQALGEKTGKYAFFEAREANKSKVRTTGDSAVTTPAFETLARSEFPKFQEIESHYTSSSPASPPLESNQAYSLFHRNQGPDGLRTTSSEPSNAPDSDRLPQTTPPKLPLTEAEIRPILSLGNQSVNVENQDKSPQPCRSKLSIRDILDDSSTTLSNNCNSKRKADEISGTLENEVRLWASSSPLDLTVDSQPGSGSQVIAVPKLPEVIHNHLPESIQQRPVKRLKKVAEKMGYAALGGAFVGASLFSILVATAPDFL